MKISCLIIEDEPKALQLLKEYVAEVSYLELRHAYSNALEALHYLQEHSVDLLFLDKAGVDDVGVVHPRKAWGMEGFELLHSFVYNSLAGRGDQQYVFLHALQVANL